MDQVSRVASVGALMLAGAALGCGQDHPQLTVRNLTFVDGNARGEDPDGGGAIFVLAREDPPVINSIIE